jgi:membrane protein DedA with SNARE-associated domain
MEIPIQLVKTYGSLGVFASLMLGMFGLPVPDETILTFTGFLISKRYLKAAPAVVAAFLGSICGITLNYTVGRTLGLHFLRKYGHLLRITEEKLDKVHDWFDRYGKWTLTVGYFFPGVRHLAPLVAGASRLQLRVFAPFSYCGGLLWAIAFISLGYFMGAEWRRVVFEIRTYLWLGLGLALVLVIVYFLVQARKSRGQ